MDRGMLLRKNLLEKDCAFIATITADYGSFVHTFQMDCTANAAGELHFTVIKPDSISGITGSFSAAGGKLTFDKEILLFEMLADGQITPVSAPWMMIRTLQQGYMHACGFEGDGLRLQLHDSYRDDALQMDIWTDANDNPVCGEIVFAGRRILSVDVENFAFM